MVRKTMFTHIAYNPEILSGKPHIAGTRLSIEFILEPVTSGATRDEILKAYPQLTAKVVEEALRCSEFQKTMVRVLNKNEEWYKRQS